MAARSAQVQLQAGILPSPRAGGNTKNFLKKSLDTWVRGGKEFYFHQLYETVAASTTFIMRASSGRRRKTIERIYDRLLAEVAGDRS
jgi:hypothetical protein